jgi:hypothetical protein
MSAETVTRRNRDRVLSGARVPRTRPEIAASWRRVTAAGLDPGSDPSVPALGPAELERRRAASGLGELLPHLESSVAPALAAGELVVVSDTEGRVLWRLGSSGVRRRADALGFTTGSAWTERNVGTNAIGTSLVTGEPVQIRGGEHFVESHTSWGCAAAPVRDPWTGRTLGVLDVSGPSGSSHPAELGMVGLAARLAAVELVAAHRRDLDRLRSVALPLVSGVRGRYLVVDPHGHTALAGGFDPPARVALPGRMEPGPLRLPHLGAAVAESVPRGWLLRLAADEQAPVTGLELDLRDVPLVRVSGPETTWSRDLSPRHAEILLSLVRASEAGRTAAEVGRDVFDDPTRLVTVRAEVSRLRRMLGGLLLSQPYRLAPAVTATVTLPSDPAGLLSLSSAPVVEAVRRQGRSGLRRDCLDDGGLGPQTPGRQ